MKRVALFLFLCGCLLPLAADGNLAVGLQAALSTERPDEVQKTIVDWVETHGGRTIVWSRARLSLRLPGEKAAELAALLKTLPGRVSGLSQSAEDVAERIGDARARLSSRQEALRKNMEIMGRTNVVNTLDVEKAVTALIDEIEAAEGEIRFLSDRARFAVVELSFRFQPVSRPENRGSAFPAIRGLDLNDFLKTMRGRYETKSDEE